MYVPVAKHLFGGDDEFSYLLLLFTLVHYTSNWYLAYTTLRAVGIYQVYQITHSPAKICKCVYIVFCFICYHPEEVFQGRCVL